MTVQAESGIVSDKQQQRKKGWGFKPTAVEERDGQVTLRREIPGFRARRDRIYPDMSAATAKTGEDDRRSRRRKNLNIKTDVSATQNSASTPHTAASTPTTPNGVRGSADLRSPGQRATPRAAAPVPDFITQTDKYGNASTPRSAAAIQSSQTEATVADSTHLLACDAEKNQELVDVCTETLLDSVRLMCCCLIPEDGPSKTLKKSSEKALLPLSRPSGLLPKLHPDDTGKKCLVLDLDETLVHSSFRAVPGADFVIPVQIEDVVHFVYVAKRPGVDEFLTEMAKHYELVIYTASLNKYADPLLDLLDPNRVIRARLFRESCVYHEGNYVKDLSKLDRALSDTIIIDNSPNSYVFQPDNAIDCSSFIDDPRDRELAQIAAFLTGIKDVRDVRGICRKWREWPDVQLLESQ